MGVIVYSDPNDNWLKDRQDDEFEYSARACVYSLIGIIVILLFSWLFSGCGCVKKAVYEESNIKDSVRIETIEKVVKVPVIVTVEVPAEKQERMTNDTTSVLETGFAKSTASLMWKNDIPFLFHSLENKPNRIEKSDSVPVVEREVVKWNTRTEYKTEIVEKEKPLYWWQKVCMDAGIVSLAICIIVVLALIIGVFMRR